MQRVPERPQRRFAQRRVGVDRARRVFEPRAHFDRVAECRGELRRAAAHRLPADDQVVVAARIAQTPKTGRRQSSPPE
jgi:hypothetical protein